MALDESDKEWIMQQIRQTTQYSSRLLGDTPTDANQFVPKKYLNATLFCGATGTNSDFLPPGWSASSGGAFTTITHNLGTLGYSVATIPYATGFNRDYTTIICDRSVNSFQVEQILSGSDSAVGFFFILVKNINT